MSNKIAAAMRLVCFAFFLLTIGSPFLEGCKKTRSIAPVATTLDSMMVPPLSYIAIPVRYNLALFEDFLNEKISLNFLSKGMPMRQQKDSVYLELSKNGRIKLSIRDARLHIEFPLHAEGVYFSQVLGIKIHNKNPIRTDMILALSADVVLGEDWRIHPKILLSNIQWVKNPFVKIGPIKFDLKDALDKMIAEKQSQIERTLESQIHDHASLEKAVHKIWLSLQKPMLIVTTEPRIWYKMRFERISGRLLLQAPDSIVFDVLMEARTAMSSDSTRLPPTDSILPPLHQYANDIKENFNISIHASLPFDHANSVLNKLLSGKKVEKQGYKAVIQGIELYGTDKGIAVKLKVGGDIKGELYLVGRPQYYKEDGILRIDSFNFDINTENLFVSAANMMLREPLIDYVKPYLEIEMGHYLSQVSGLISEAVEKGKAGKGIDLNIDTLMVWDHYGIATRRDIQMILRTRGQANVELQKLKTGKKMRIR